MVLVRLENTLIMKDDYQFLLHTKIACQWGLGTAVCPKVGEVVDGCSQVVLGNATILSLNCDISKMQYCNRTLFAETIIWRRRLCCINSDNRSTNRLRVVFN